MRNAALFILASVANVFANPSLTCGQAEQAYDVRVAFINGEFLYTTEKEIADERKVFDQMFLIRTCFDKTAHKPRGGDLEIVRYHVDGLPEKGTQYRWRFAHGCFWGNGDVPSFKRNIIKRFLEEELIFADTRDPNGWAAFWRKHSKTPDWFLDAVTEVVRDDYEDRHPKRDPLLRRGAYGPDPGHKIEGIYYDFLPTTATTLTFFILWKDKIRVWAAVAVKSAGEYTEFDVKCEEDKNETIAVDFKEPFQVFGKERTYYFVTHSGKLYCSPKPASNGKRQAEALWKDEKLPIRAVICDTASERTFVFTEPAKKGGERVYFELAKSVESKPYERVPVEGVKEPLKTVMEYAQVLVKDKRIK